MTMLALLSAAGDAALPDRMDPLTLFLDADIVVKAVMIGLVLASIWSWMIIVSFSLKMQRIDRRNAAFEDDFWDAENPEALVSGRKRPDVPSARVAAMGLAELRRSTKDGLRDRNGARERMGLAMEGQVATEAENLGARLTFLATLGSVAPFVGLFGTVWGIMNSFFSIGIQQNSSLAVVAPGIAEALFATAIGLFAAIPAVIAYNRYSGKVNLLEARLQRFADRVLAQASREMEGA